MKQDNSSGYEALRGGAALVDRPAGRLLMRGADRRAYLQGLLTNDVAALVPGSGCYAAMLTAQGRMITDMRVLELGDRILLDVPPQVTTAIKDHLERFVFSEDVQLEDVTETLAEVGLYGPGALDVLAETSLEGGVPSAIHASTRARLAGVEATVVASIDFGAVGYDVLVERSGEEAVRGALLHAGASVASAGDVEALRIERGRPLFGRDMDSDTIPLEAGIEDRAISRSKGCYVGQEVIVRVQDRGHGRVARRLVGITFEPSAPVPSAGTEIRGADRDIGCITSAVWSPALARPIALGYVQRDFVAPGTHVSVGAADGIVASLPFI